MTPDQNTQPSASHPLPATANSFARLLDRVLLRTKAALRIGEPYRSGETTLRLSPGHTLAMHQRHYPLYDRFLPHLARSLEAGSMIVDVGANCGDTLAGMHAANPALSFVAIEPDDLFFSLLERNVALLSAGRSGLRAYLVKALVGMNVAGAKLVGSGGTKRAVVETGDAQTHRSRTLDDILSALAIEQVRVLKSDVDGFDYDVLESASQTLATSMPLLFFETQIDHAFQRDGFMNIFETLARRGYAYWVLFDNFGSVCVRTTDVAVARQLVDYPWKNGLSGSRRTVNYFDVLGASEADRSFVDAVVDSYERSTPGNLFG